MSEPTADMVGTFVRLHDALKQTDFPLDLPGVEAARESREEMVSQLEDYILPRLIQIDAPLLTVVGGSTGAGKSTLVNALVGEQVTEAGVLRPTTRSPVLVHHPDDAAWFEEARILPDFERTSGASADPGALQLVASARVPRGLAILDAPDIDSVEQRNRELASQLLSAADMWLFVTSAARYADQVPWDFLRKASDRSAAVAIVLDRTPASAVEEIATHLTRMLQARGLRDSPLFTVAESSLDDAGMLPADAVADIRAWLDGLASDADARAAVVRQTLGGAVRTTASRTHEVADAYDEQVRMVQTLRTDVVDTYAQAVAQIDAGSADGTLLRGEVLARWQEFVGTGELLKSLESRISWVRDRITRAVRGEPASASRVTVAVESGLQTLLLEHAEAAAEHAGAAWGSTTPGRTLLADASEDLSRASRSVRPRSEELVREWQHGVLEMVRSEGADKRMTARVLAYGVNGLAVSLMVVVFASTGGLSGAEFGIAGGSAVIGQKLLEAVFGDQAVRRLAYHARADLKTRVEALMGSERERYLGVLDRLAIDEGRSADLRRTARRIDNLRFSEEGAW